MAKPPDVNILLIKVHEKLSSTNIGFVNYWKKTKIWRKAGKGLFSCNLRREILTRVRPHVEILNSEFRKRNIFQTDKQMKTLGAFYQCCGILMFSTIDFINLSNTV